MSLTASLERLYRQFSVYPCPADLEVCEQCGPEWSADDIRGTPLRSVSLPQLCAVHVMSLDDDALRHFFPRVMDVLLHTDSPVFDFRLADLKQRLPAWQSGEISAVRQLAERIFSQLLTEYPAELGYFSDCPSALDFLHWCGLPLTAHLDMLLSSETQAAARHLADLVDVVLTEREPFETAPRAKVLNWLRDPAVGERLQTACLAANADDVAQHLSDAHDLWATCAQ